MTSKILAFSEYLKAINEVSNDAEDPFEVADQLEEIINSNHGDLFVFNNPSKNDVDEAVKLLESKFSQKENFKDTDWYAILALSFTF